MEGARDEVEERAVPFREGDEVLVHIVEPHMYDVDDAVAKIDGYIVSVAGAGPLVGEKRLVRIEEAGRTSATAVLVDPTRRQQGSPGWRTTAMTYNPALGAAAAEADGAVRVPRPTPPRRRIPRKDLMDYAIVKTGGKQYRVEEGQTLLVERLASRPGRPSTCSRCCSARRTPSSTRRPGQGHVRAEIVGHERGKKIRVFKFKPKRGYKRTAGHRQELTRIRITEISNGS